MSEVNAEQWNLENIKSYADSWWLKYLEVNTVFDAEQIKAQKYWLIEEVQELKGFTDVFVNLLEIFWGENNRTNKQMSTVRHSGFRAVKENEKFQDQIDVMDGHLVRCGGEIIDKENERAELQCQLDKIKSLVNSNKVAHAVKFELQMMFKDADQR